MVVDQNFEVIETIGMASANGVFIYPLSERKFKYQNDSFFKIFQLSRDTSDLPGKLLEKIVPDDVAYLEACFGDLLEKKHVSNVEFSAVMNDGILRYYLIDCYLIYEDVVVGFVKDTSREKEHANYMINYGGRKDTILEMLSHNLSAPLMLTQRVLTLVDKAYKEQRYHGLSNHIKFIEESTAQCIDIIHDFLKEEHFVSERIYVKQARFDVVEKVRLIVEKFKQSYNGNKLDFKPDVKKLFVVTDDMKFLQVVNNVISNALKFTPANCAVEVFLKEGEDNFMLIVKDDGIGIPDHLQPLIFQKYTPAGRRGLQGEKSIGVGLSIVKRLVELMKGHIKFESRENVGTTFYLTFPKQP